MDLSDNRLKLVLYAISTILILTVMPDSASAQHRKMVKANPQPSPRTIDYEALVPTNAKAVLDSMFDKWSFRTGIVEYDSRDRQVPTSPFQECFVNNDTLPDYALHIIVSEDSTTTEQFLVLLAEGRSFRPITLESRTRDDPDFGFYYQVLYKAGFHFWVAPFEDGGDPRSSFPVDCIGVLMRVQNSCNIYLFDNGKFKVFSPCD